MLKEGPKLFFLPISEIWKCKRPEGWAGGTNNPLTAKCIFLLSNLVAKLKQTVTEMHMNYICMLYWAIKLWKVTKQSESGDPNKKTKQRSPKIKVKYKIKDLSPTSSPSFFFFLRFLTVLCKSVQNDHKPFLHVVCYVCVKTEFCEQSESMHQHDGKQETLRISVDLQTGKQCTNMTENKKLGEFLNVLRVMVLQCLLTHTQHCHTHVRRNRTC